MAAGDGEDLDRLCGLWQIEAAHMLGEAPPSAERLHPGSRDADPWFQSTHSTARCCGRRAAKRSGGSAPEGRAL